ncbi:hypothetical protein [Peribacillus deserti]|uniref:Uncharacterized protein n=1 Tax=Peribacillus deserti TaxID=673318 RepID=A0A2N5M504_9BACI|nr:hypothetical protein [Peribacillus deserti]PLT29446.1 hypothetical protein CUU66_13165 [Peribacillus deserti]
MSYEDALRREFNEKVRMLMEAATDKQLVQQIKRFETIDKSSVHPQKNMMLPLPEQFTEKLLSNADGLVEEILNEQAEGNIKQATEVFFPPLSRLYEDYSHFLSIVNHYIQNTPDSKLEQYKEPLLKLKKQLLEMQNETMSLFDELNEKLKGLIGLPSFTTEAHRDGEKQALVKEVIEVVSRRLQLTRSKVEEQLIDVLNGMEVENRDRVINAAWSCGSIDEMRCEIIDPNRTGN